MTAIVLGLSVFTFICAATFLGVVVRWNRDMSVYNNPFTQKTWSIWIWIMVAVCMTFFLALCATLAHIGKFMEKLSMSLKSIAMLDILVVLFSLAAWVTWVAYFYGSLSGGGTSFGKINFDGVEIAFGVLTFVFSTATALMSFVSEDKESS